MVTLRALALADAPALTCVYSGATTIRHATGRPLTLDQAQEKVCAALAPIRRGRSGAGASSPRTS
ncbi:hypothetical protein ACFXG6_25320 [Streptomyces roseus]|uniref:hypothetical protein n=1 Tax=Streptomyces roseus TaxID=66430 RepID=UPI0036C69DD2